jgi:hypothetical protein
MFFKKRTPQNAGRPRTAQPTQRNVVFSYASSRSTQPGATGRDTAERQEETLRRGPRFPWLRRVPRVAALFAVLIVIIASLQLSSDPKVEIIGAKDAQVFLRDRDLYQAAASQAFAPFLNSNKLTVDANSIAASLRKQFPELAEVSVSLPIIGNKPVVYIQPAEPKIILLSKGGMYLLDGNGRALIAGNQVQQLNKLHISVVTDESGLPVKLGKVALPRATVQFISEVAGQLQAKHTAITAMNLPAGTNELQVRIEGAGYYIRFNLHGKAREGVGSYLAVRQYLQDTHKTAGEYIDVRIENKVYYR